MKGILDDRWWWWQRQLALMPSHNRNSKKRRLLLRLLLLLPRQLPNVLKMSLIFSLPLSSTTGRQAGRCLLTDHCLRSMVIDRTTKAAEEEEKEKSSPAVISLLPILPIDCHILTKLERMKWKGGKREKRLPFRSQTDSPLCLLYC